MISRPLISSSKNIKIFRGNVMLRSLSEKYKQNPEFLSLKEKYKVFTDREAPVIYDIEEERYAHKAEDITTEQTEGFSETNLKRGITGVFEVEELVHILRKENAQDICVIQVPPKFKYVDFLVIASGKSLRHITGLAECIRLLYKKKMDALDLIPKIEGPSLSEWLALDLGNIALHIMSHKFREKYDIESLWSVGTEFDINSNIPEDTITGLIEKHCLTLDDLQPCNIS